MNDYVVLRYFQGQKIGIVTPKLEEHIGDILPFGKV